MLRSIFRDEASAMWQMEILRSQQALAQDDKSLSFEGGNLSYLNKFH